MCDQSFSCVQHFATSWTVARQASPSMEFSRQEYWSAQPFPSLDFPTQGLNLGLLLCRQILYHMSRQGRSLCLVQFYLFYQQNCNPHPYPLIHKHSKFLLVVVVVKLNSVTRSTLRKCHIIENAVHFTYLFYRIIIFYQIIYFIN